MKRARLLSQIVAVALLVALPALGVPVAAAESAGVAGVVVSSASRAPLTGARVHVADASGGIFSSSATDATGRFAIDALPAAAYEVAVEVDGGLYVVDSRLAIAPGQTRDVSLAIDDRAPSGTMNAKQGSTATKLSSAWNNPGVAVALVVGTAFVVGALVDDAVDDDPASKFLPN